MCFLVDLYENFSSISLQNWACWILDMDSCRIYIVMDAAVRIAFFPTEYPPQREFFFSHLKGIKWHLIVAFIFTFLIEI